MEHDETPSVFVYEALLHYASDGCCHFTPTLELCLVMYKFPWNQGIYFRPVMELQWSYESYVSLELFGCSTLDIRECN